MRRFVSFTLFVLVLTLPAQLAQGSLYADILQAIKTSPLEGAGCSVSVREADSDSILIDMDAERALIPASNMKLLTTGAALHILGPEFRFRTRMKRTGDTVILIGDGDPALGDPILLADMKIEGLPGLDIETFIDLIAQPIADLGMDQISELIIDDRIFDREYVHPTWPTEQLNRRYCAQVTGLNLHLNVLHFFPRPIKGARPDISHFQPAASWMNVANRATSNTGARARQTAWVARKLGTNELTVYGNVRNAYKMPVPVTVHDMPSFLGTILKYRLRDRGITVNTIRLAGPDDDFADAEPFGPEVTTTIATAITRCNQDSQNMYAEALLKRSGAHATRQPGSWVNGSSVVRHAVMERIGDPSLTASLIVADGSGMSRSNRVSPAMMTAWLGTFHRDERLEEPFIESLAVARESGTMAKRFHNVDLQGGIVHAKSGYINNVSCLAGYITMPNGNRRTFSIMLNDLPTLQAVRAAKKLQEEIVALVAEDMAGAPLTLGSD